ncbi:extracellular solute-binding protein [Paenibacillus paridis]|uniref:extracellular solute-binding protein n=1 Tax=Paenibacillus paridis TaxID=2583376 RepID=UPI001122553D|nr:extracellular solute-binding protein [Paenibacillus paridis]
MKNKGMSTKKLGLIGITVMMLIAILSACSGSNDKPQSSPKESATAEPGQNNGEKTPPAETMEISWMPLPGNLVENSYAQQYIEKKFNIKIKPYLNPQDGYMDKQRILLGSGDIPDVFYVPDPQDINRYAAQGLIAEVPKELIEQHAADSFKVLNDFAPQAWYYSNYNGSNYGLPTVYYTGQYNSKQIWRDDLLKKAGVESIPVTLEEYENAFAKLKAIGVYGITSYGNSDYNQFHSIFGAFGIMPIQWMEKDGRIVNGAVQPEAKEALALLADWFKKGYIDPEFVTGKELDVKFANGKVAFFDSGATNALDETNPNSMISKIKQLNPEGSVAFGELPKGPGGQYGWAWGTGGHIWAFGKQLQGQPEKMAKILEIMNTIQNDEETFKALAWGEEGKHWSYNDAAAGLESGLKRLSPFDDGAKLQAEGLRDAGMTTAFANQGNPALYEKFASKQDLELLKLNSIPKTDLFGKSGVLPSSGTYWGDLSKLKVEAYTAIIFGNKPVSYFDDFVKQWNDLGGEQLEKEANELYAQIKK